MANAFAASMGRDQQTSQLQQNQLFLELNQSYFQLVSTQNSLMERFNRFEQYVLTGVLNTSDVHQHGRLSLSTNPNASGLSNSSYVNDPYGHATSQNASVHQSHFGSSFNNRGELISQASQTGLNGKFNAKPEWKFKRNETLPGEYLSHETKLAGSAQCSQQDDGMWLSVYIRFFRWFVVDITLSKRE